MSSSQMVSRNIGVRTRWLSFGRKGEAKSFPKASEDSYERGPNLESLGLMSKKILSQLGDKARTASAGTLVSAAKTALAFTLGATPLLGLGAHVVRMGMQPEGLSTRGGAGIDSFAGTACHLVGSLCAMAALGPAASGAVAIGMGALATTAFVGSGVLLSRQLAKGLLKS